MFVLHATNQYKESSSPSLTPRPFAAPEANGTPCLKRFQVDLTKPSAHDLLEGCTSTTSRTCA